MTFEITFKLDEEESIHTVTFTKNVECHQLFIESQSDDDLEDLVYVHSAEIDVDNTRTIKVIDIRTI